jgi:hypothetical protein
VDVAAFNDGVALARVRFGAGLSRLIPSPSVCVNLVQVEGGSSLVALGRQAFLGCSGLVGLELGGGGSGGRPLAIGASAFVWCSALRNVTFLPGVTELGESAFRACPLEALVIPPSVKLKLLGACTFADWRELARVELGGVTEVGVRAFYGCSGLYVVTFPACLEKVQMEAFAGCPLREVQVGLEEVSDVSLSLTVSACVPGCRELTALRFSPTVRTMGNGSFDGWRALRSVTFVEGLEVIGERAFHACSGLVSVALPRTLTRVGAHAFEKCEALVRVVFDAAPVAIETHAFSHCPLLVSIVLPPRLAGDARGTTSVPRLCRHR